VYICKAHKTHTHTKEKKRRRKKKQQQQQKKQSVVPVETGRDWVPTKMAGVFVAPSNSAQITKLLRFSTYLMLYF